MGSFGKGEVLGLVSWPITVRKPPRESCSGSVGFSFASMPTSILAEPPTFWSVSSQIPEPVGAWRKTLKMRDCEIAS